MEANDLLILPQIIIIVIVGLWIRRHMWYGPK